MQFMMENIQIQLFQFEGYLISLDNRLHDLQEWQVIHANYEVDIHGKLKEELKKLLNKLEKSSFNYTR